MELSVHMIFVMIPVLLSCMVRNLKYLTPFSTIANIFMACGLAAVLYKATQDLPSISSRNYIADWHQLPLYFGTAVYSFEGIGLVSIFFILYAYTNKCSKSPFCSVSSASEYLWTVYFWFYITGLYRFHWSIPTFIK